MASESTSPLLSASNATELETIAKANTGCLLTLHFWASWAKQCEQMDDVLKELAKDTKLVNVKFVKIEAEEVPDLCERYSVEAVPTMILLKNGRLVDRVNGANSPALAEKVRANAEKEPPLSDGPAFSADRGDAEPLEDRLKRLVAAKPVMLFMKGTPTAPRCGFSKTTLAILKEQGVSFGHFDILSDEAVRQGLKTFSNWPTYPQLYVGGSLLGGLDIIKELVEGGEFLEQIPDEAKKVALEDRLKALVRKEKVMVFMKGSPEAPRCGFSKRLVAILADVPDLAYGHFDILTDDEVRQGLKTFSNWPTYPQIYVDGEMVGGLDIIEELKEGDELKSTLMGE